MDWFRSHHGAPTDPKWRAIAKRAGVRPLEVAAVYWALLDHASQQDDRGDVTQFDVETVSSAFDVEMTTIEAILKALTDKGVIVDGRIAKWEKFQPKREDSSTERVRKFRETKRNAMKRTETVEQSREEKIREEDANASKARARRQSEHARQADAEFELWYTGYPNKVGKQAARLAYSRARRKVPAEILLTARDRYISAKPADREWCNPATWLNQERWCDEPAALAVSSKPGGLYGGAML